MPLPPRPVVLVALALRRRLKQIADRLVPPEIAMLDLSAGSGGVQVAAAIAELGIADLIADRAMTARAIAAHVDSDPATTHRLLRAAVGYGLCTMHRRTGAVKLARTGTALSGDHRASVREWTRYMGLRSTVQSWSGLIESVRTGGSAFHAAHGMSVWDWFAAHPEEERLFAAAMRQTTAINADAIARAYPWPKGGVVCDVAGGIGTLLAAIVARADLRGVLVEATGVIAEAEAYLADCGVVDRIDLAPGDLFGAIDVAADVYLLKDVLHDWDDERCAKILATVAAAMPRGSRLLLVEIIQQPNAPNPLAPFVDLQMLTQTDGGRQRSAPELSRLLADAGLRPTGRVSHATPHDLFEAVKP